MKIYLHNACFHIVSMWLSCTGLSTWFSWHVPWFNPSQQIPHSCSLSPPHLKWEENLNKKVNLMDWNQNNLMIKIKCYDTSSSSSKEEEREE